MRQLTKAQRKSILLKTWKEMVGELPESGSSKLPNYAKLYGMLPVLRAIEKYADDDALEDSEAVLEAVEKILKAWDKRGWCAVPVEEILKGAAE